MAALMTMAPQRRAVSTGRNKQVAGRRSLSPLDLIAVTTSVLRPFLVTVAVLVASVASASRAQADQGDAAIEVPPAAAPFGPPGGESPMSLRGPGMPR